MSKKKKTICTVLGSLSVLAIVLGIALFIKSRYTINTVYVEGNVHYSEDEIKEIVMSGPFGNNSLFLSLKYRNKGIENVPFVDVMDVEVLSPDTIKIKVIEKMLTGYVKYLDTYMYFDKDGYIVESSGKRTAGVPQVTGLSFDHIVVGEMLPVENKDIFSDILTVTKLLNKYNLLADKIYFSGSGEITLYFGDLRVTLGDESLHLEDKLMILPELVSKLNGRNGVLQMTVFDENGSYIFKPEQADE